MPVRSAVRAVVTDLDGTVVHHDGTVSDATLTAAADLAARRIPLIAATARTPPGVATIGSLTPYLTIAVCSGGAVGWVPSTAETLWRETIAPAGVDRLVRFTVARLAGAGMAVHDGQTWRMTGAYARQRGDRLRGRKETVPVADLARHPACAMSICHPDRTSDELMRAVTALGGGPAPTVTYSTTHVVDIAPAGVDKSSGVRRALAVLGVAPADAVAVGDMPNDLPMFALCGVAVAVAGAHPDVLAAATVVTSCIHDDGFARALHALGAVDGGRIRRPGCTACGPVPA
ncbi:Cof-type HAD-IIB family hydrolase [Virgisporangium ochraceum]|uniref:Haloacid dehalogenase n=1 Tax=Virgisporangium ochraceum TaxID=65505 RepID=A0A8J4EEF2_9ACTN|nr:HAD family hydrolase [Virgisporangium ochraceum]GIJ72520.1 haloacid dehalogenase [Virgisporangium ochraceum]